MSEKIIVSKEIAGRTLSLETGALAKQAGASVLVRYGDTVVLAAVTASSKPREGIDFFPLVVDFEEKFYAAGKIPGGFIKREGRPSEKSILSGRMIDRSIRPLFPEGLCHEVQVVATVLSADQENDADILGLIAASAALTISDIPFNGPIAAARIGRLGEEFIVNPTLQQIQESSLNLVLSASKTSIAMVEAGAHELSEELMLQAFELAQTECHKIVELIEELAAQAAKPKRAFPLSLPDKDLESFMRTHLSASIAAAMRILNKKERNEAFDKITKEALIAVIQETGGSMREQLLGILMDDKRFDFAKILDKIQEEELRKMIVNEKLRSDGRQFDEIRPITCEVAVLPRTHGSSIFTRGETQVLNAVTLGTVSDEQIIDGLGLEDSKRYMHQYNFPPYSVGEVKPLRGPGRREIGHGALAERALIPMLPSEEEFPYTLRLVSEVLESNGSSSMASTCASTLALMDAGVPIKKPVAGIAMGLVELEHDFVVLTDIQGLEDHLGDMDFKVTGTRDGITALQMDIKLQGISQAVLQDALAKARNARLFILDKMTACIAEPRADLSPYAPRIIMMTIDVEKIKDVIGSGGKVINKIIADTGVKIDIENDGRVLIASVNQEAGEKARAIIENIVKVPEIGEVYLGKAVRLMNFGVFVEFAPGKEGLVHISQLAPYRVEKVEDIVKVGDEFPVKIMEIDPQGKINLSRKALLPGAVEDEDNGGGRHPRHGKYNGGGRPSRFRH